MWIFLLLLLAGCQQKQKKPDVTPYKYVTFKVSPNANNATPIEARIVATSTPQLSQDIKNSTNKLMQSGVDTETAQNLYNSVIDLPNDVMDKSAMIWSCDLVEDSVSNFILWDYDSAKTDKCLLILKYGSNMMDMRIKTLDLETCKDRSIVQIDKDDVRIVQVADKPMDVILLKPQS